MVDSISTASQALGFITQESTHLSESVYLNDDVCRVNTCIILSYIPLVGTVIAFIFWKGANQSLDNDRNILQEKDLSGFEKVHLCRCIVAAVGLGFIFFPIDIYVSYNRGTLPGQSMADQIVYSRV